MTLITMFSAQNFLVNSLKKNRPFSYFSVIFVSIKAHSRVLVLYLKLCSFFFLVCLTITMQFTTHCRSKRSGIVHNSREREKKT